MVSCHLDSGDANRLLGKATWLEAVRGASACSMVADRLYFSARCRSAETRRDGRRRRTAQSPAARDRLGDGNQPLACLREGIADTLVAWKELPCSKRRPSSQWLLRGPRQTATFPIRMRRN